MKFWFCESCGKRLTDADLAEGRGRDKKLKGVYCQVCAAGVLTMEQVPLTDERARELLKAEAPARRKISVHTIQPALAEGHGRNLPRSPAPPAPRASNSRTAMTVVAVIAGSIAMLSGLMIAARGRDTQPQTPKASAETPAPAANPWNRTKSAPRPAPPVAPPPTPRETPPVQPPAAETEPSARKAPEPAAIVASLPEPELPAATPVPPPEANPEEPGPVPAAVAEPPPAAHPAELAAAAYAEFSDEFLALLRKRDADAAQKRLDAALKHEALQDESAKIRKDERLIPFSRELETAFPKGLERLKEVEDFNLSIAMMGEPLRVGTRAPFQVKEIAADALKVGNKMLEMKVPLNDLPAETKHSVTELGLGSDRKGMVLKAFSLLVAEKGLDEMAFRAAVERAQKAGAGEDAELLLSKLDTALRGAWETAAEAALAKFDGAFAAKNWAEAERAGANVLKTLGDTEAVRKRAGLREQVATAARLGAPVVEYTLTLQEGVAIPEASIEKYEGTRNVHLFGNPGHEHRRPPIFSGALIYGGAKRMVLVGFKLFDYEGGFLPSNTEILEATLCLRRSRMDNDLLYEFREVLSPWNPEEATWASAATGKLWKTPGADLGDTVAASASVDKDDRLIEADVTESLRGMLKEKRNYGWGFNAFLKKAPPRLYPNILGVHAKDYQNLSFRPKLVLTVRCPKLAAR